MSFQFPQFSNILLLFELSRAKRSIQVSKPNRHVLIFQKCLSVEILCHLLNQPITCQVAVMKQKSLHLYGAWPQPSVYSFNPPYSSNYSLQRGTERCNNGEGCIKKGEVSSHGWKHVPKTGEANWRMQANRNIVKVFIFLGVYLIHCKVADKYLTHRNHDLKYAELWSERKIIHPVHLCVI